MPGRFSRNGGGGRPEVELSLATRSSGHIKGECFDSQLQETINLMRDYVYEVAKELQGFNWTIDVDVTLLNSHGNHAMAQACDIFYTAATPSPHARSVLFTWRVQREDEAVERIAMLFRDRYAALKPPALRIEIEYYD